MNYWKCILMTSFSLFCLAGGAIPPAAAQFFHAAHARVSSTVQGTVVRECAGSQDNSFEYLHVELSGRQNLHRAYSADVRWDGGFEIRDVADGVYEARVLNLRGTVLRGTLFNVTSMGNSQDLRLAIPCAEKPGGGTVSLRRLSHKPPKAAVTAMRRAVAAQAKGNVAGWEKSLRRATAIDPEYFEARNNLGAFLARNNRCQEAIAEFQAALELDPGSAAVMSNISAALLSLNRAREAEEYARRALAIDPLSPQAHYLAGVSLVRQNRFTEEAAGHLHDSGSRFPKALAVEANIRERIRRQAAE